MSALWEQCPVAARLNVGSLTDSNYKVRVGRAILMRFFFANRPEKVTMSIRATAVFAANTFSPIYNSGAVTQGFTSDRRTRINDKSEHRRGRSAARSILVTERGSGRSRNLKSSGTRWPRPGPLFSQEVFIVDAYLMLREVIDAL